MNDRLFGRSFSFQGIPMDDARRLWLQDVILLVLAVLALYGQTLSWPALTWDDHLYVGQRPGLSWEGLRHAFDPAAPGHHFGYRPVHLLSYRLDESLFGGAAFGYRLTSLGLHVAAVLLVYSAVARLGAPAAAFWGALLFALFPYHSEAVAWLAERKGAVALVLMLAATHCDLQLRASGRWRWLGGAALCYTGSLLSKSMWVTWPLLMFGVGLLCRRTVLPCRRWCLSALPLYLALAGGAAVLQLQVGNAGGEVALGSGVLERGAFVLTTYGHYLLCALDPYGTMPVNVWAWQWVDEGRPPSVWVVASTLALVALALASLSLWRRGVRWAAVALLWFVAGLLPVSNLVPMLYPHGDRFLYGPSLGLLLPLGGALAWLGARGGAWRLVPGALALFFLLCGWVAVLPWRSDLTLWQHELAQDPESQHGHCFLGVTLDQQYGQTAEAVPHYKAAIAGPPGRHYHAGPAATAAIGLVQAYGRLGRPGDALRTAERLSADPRLPEDTQSSLLEWVMESSGRRRAPPDMSN